MTETQLLSIRIPADLARRLDRLTKRGRTKTSVATELLSLGLDRVEAEELATGFALLGEPEMQDMDFPTGAQLEAIRLAD